MRGTEYGAGGHAAVSGLILLLTAAQGCFLPFTFSLHSAVQFSNATKARSPILISEIRQVKYLQPESTGYSALPSPPRLMRRTHSVTSSVTIPLLARNETNNYGIARLPCDSTAFLLLVVINIS